MIGYFSPFSCSDKDLGGYAAKTNEGTLINYLGLTVVCFCVTVVYMVCNPSYKRLTKPEDEILLRETTNE